MALRQTHYRFGSVDGTEATHGWINGEDRETYRLAGAAGQFLLRVNVQASGGVAHGNTAFEWQYRLTPAATGIAGEWTNITTSSAVARTGANAVFSNGANCTKRLSGTGTFEASGAGCTHDGTSGGTANDIAANGCSETLIGLQLINADTAIGDLIEFRVTSGGVVLAGYDAIPTLRVSVDVLAAQSRDTSVHTTTSAATTRISRSLVDVRAYGMSPADLSDATLTMTMSVLGTTVAGSIDPADYTVAVMDPTVWAGGFLGKNGIFNPPGFMFIKDMPQDIKRVLATYQPSRACVFGVQACIIDLP